MNFLQNIIVYIAIFVFFMIIVPVAFVATTISILLLAVNEAVQFIPKGYRKVFQSMKHYMMNYKEDF